MECGLYDHSGKSGFLNRPHILLIFGEELMTVHPRILFKRKQFSLFPSYRITIVMYM